MHSADIAGDDLNRKKNAVCRTVAIVRSPQGTALIHIHLQTPHCTAMTIYISKLCSLFQWIALFTVLANAAQQSVNLANAADCRVGSNSSSSPCCNIAVLSDVYFGRQQELFTFSTCQFRQCSICGETNSQNTVNAASHQRLLDQAQALYTTHNCFGGQSAVTPGSSVEQVGTVCDTVATMKHAACDVNFDVSSALANSGQPSFVKSVASNSTAEGTCQCDCCSGLCCTAASAGLIKASTAVTCNAQACAAAFPEQCPTSSGSAISTFAAKLSQTTTSEASYVRISWLLTIASCVAFAIAH